MKFLLIAVAMLDIFTLNLQSRADEAPLKLSATCKDQTGEPNVISGYDVIQVGNNTIRFLKRNPATGALESEYNTQGWTCTILPQKSPANR